MGTAVFLGQLDVQGLGALIATADDLGRGHVVGLVAGVNGGPGRILGVDVAELKIFESFGVKNFVLPDDAYDLGAVRAAVDCQLSFVIAFFFFGIRGGRNGLFGGQSAACGGDRKPSGVGSDGEGDLRLSSAVADLKIHGGFSDAYEQFVRSHQDRGVGAADSFGLDVVEISGALGGQAGILGG